MTEFAYNEKIFTDFVREDPFGGRLTNEQWAGLENLLDYIKFLKWLPVDAETQYFHLWNAYCMATAKHETGHTMTPNKEGGSASYLQGKDYYPYYGRGYVHITWKRNYEKSDAAILRDNLVEDPARFPDGFVNQTQHLDQALDPEVAAVNLFVGMHKGWYTGKRLWDYLRNDLKRYDLARKIVNGSDRAAEIARIAEGFERGLRAAWQPVDMVVPDPILPPEMPDPDKLPDDDVPAEVAAALAQPGVYEVRQTVEGLTVLYRNLED